MNVMQESLPLVYMLLFVAFSECVYQATGNQALESYGREVLPFEGVGPP